MRLLWKKPDSRAPRHVSGRAAVLGLFAACTLLAQAASKSQAGEGFRPAIAVSPEGLTCVLGGGLDGELVDSRIVTPLMTHNQTYSLIDLTGIRDEVVSIGRPREESLSDSGCEGTFQQELSLSARQVGEYQVAVLGERDDVRRAMPARIELTQGRRADAEGVIASYLKELGLETDRISIRQVVRADLDGDGRDETLINAVETLRETARKGEYSLVLLRTGAEENSDVLEVMSDVTLEDSGEPSSLWENVIAGIVDLNGDGTMEIVLYSSFYFGDAWQVVHLRNGEIEQPLVCGCGG